METAIEKLVNQLYEKSCYGTIPRKCGNIMVEAAKELLRQKNEIATLQVERDLAVKNLESIMRDSQGDVDPCDFCANHTCQRRGGSMLCTPRWWAGNEKSVLRESNPLAGISPKQIPTEKLDYRRGE